MSALAIVIPEEVIRKRIAADDYLPEGTKDHMTTAEFHDHYGLDMLKKLNKDVAMVEFLFGSKGQNEQSLTYSLECSPKLINYYAPAEPGNALNIIVNYAKGSWHKQRKPITEAEAISIAWQVRNSLISVLQKIDENTDAVEIYTLLQNENLPIQNWLKKYFSIMFPNRFMAMSNGHWTKRIFTLLGITPTDNWFENSKLFSEKAAYFGLDGFAMYHVVRACGIDHVTQELTERGISIEGLASRNNLLVATQSDYNEIKKHIDMDVRPAFEAYLAEKFGWDSAPISTDTVAATATPIYKNEYTQKLIQAKNIIFRGAPGTGKSYLAWAIAADLVSKGTASNEDELSEDQKKQVQFVQFHPSYDYSDFVEGLRPKIDADGRLAFDLQDGIFKKFVNTAKDHPELDYVFIIDEINRGEISKILGELFFSIDPEYRGKKEKGVLTQYANLHKDPDEKFYIPENVYIVGTMNDIDRSVDTFDFAMRRRFRFIEIAANEHMEMLNTLNNKALIDEAKYRMLKLNEQLTEEGLNSNYHIGAAYFRKLNDLDEKDPFETLWGDYLAPLLEGYVSGMHDADESMAAFKRAYNSFAHSVSSDGDTSENDNG